MAALTYERVMSLPGAPHQELFMQQLVVSDALGGLQVLDLGMSYLPTSMPYVPQAFPSPADPTLNWDGKNYGYGGTSSTFSNHDPSGATAYMSHPSYTPPPITATLSAPVINSLLKLLQPPSTDSSSTYGHNLQLLNMNTGAGNAALLASVDTTNDPIAKAVMENLLGRLPTKRPRVRDIFERITVRCEVCKLEFSSQTVLDSHLSGSKHQRKVKSANLLKSLEETEKGFDRDEQSGVIRCTVCDVTVNSPQLLATHIAGNKHKQRAAKRHAQQSSGGSSNGGPPPAKKRCTSPAGDTASTTTTPTITSNNNNNNNDDNDSNNSSASGNTDVNTKKSEDKPKCEIEVPDCVTKLEETKGGGKYLCNPCQARCNSEQQLSQHLVSRRHLEKLGVRKPSGHGGSGGWRGGRRRPSFRPGPGRGPPRGTHTYTQPLSHNFVAAATGHLL